MKLVILDRDGVINLTTSYRVINASQWEPVPGSLSAIARLKQAGFTVVIATNQSIVAKKIITIDDLHSIHNKMQNLLQKKHKVKIDKIFVCPHQEIDFCNCRKPKPGMLIDIANHYNIDLAEKQIPFVGDSIIDLQAASVVGAIPVLVQTGHGSITMGKPEIHHIKKLKIFTDLAAFVDFWLSNTLR